jgi:hypothetical protein
VTIDYQELFESFCSFVCRSHSVATKDATRLVKGFFVEHCGEGRYVFPSDGARRRKEFMLDVVILNFVPGDPVAYDEESAAHPDISAYLAVESELGGEGGTSAGPLRRNVEYDFAKLLLVRAQHKVMVFTSLPLQSELDSEEARIRALQRMYETSGEQVPVLLIHLKGKSRRTRKGVGQVEVILQRSGVSGYVLSQRSSVTKLRGGERATPLRQDVSDVSASSAASLDQNRGENEGFDYARATDGHVLLNIERTSGK